jgi:DNA-directed RNA polymerase
MGAKSVNLLPSDRPQDVYSGVARLVAKRVEEDAAAGNKVAENLVGKIDRKIVKQTVMTSVYGVTYIGARSQIANAMKDKPSLQEIWSDDSKLFLASAYITKHTFSSLKEMFLGARLIMDWLAQCARIIGKAGYPVKWTTPMGLPVVQPYKKETGERQRIETVVHKMLLYPKDKLPINTNRQR